MTAGLELLVVVEDLLSAAVMRRLLAGNSMRRCSIEPIRVMDGVDRIRQLVPVFVNACRVIPHVVLADLDREGCAPQLLADWRLTRPPAELLVRIAVREVEAWLLADADGLAEFLQVPKVKIPPQPELLEDPKRMLVNIARRSRSRRLAAERAPRPGSRAQTGPLYNQRLGGFVSESWNVERAAQEAPSLARALAALEKFIGGLPSQG